MSKIPTDSLGDMICMLTTMSRTQLVGMLSKFSGSFKLDFTRDYLDSLTVDRLRHIVLAASMQDSSAVNAA